MKSKLLLAFFVFILLYKVKAQVATDSTKYTLQQCLDYALKNHVDVVNAQLDEQISKAKVNETRAAGYPSVSGVAQVIDNPQLKRMFLGNGITPFVPFDPSRPVGAAVSIPNIFTLRSLGDGSVSINQLIFDGQYLVGLQAAKTYRELSQKNITQSKIKTIENVTKAYYFVLINQERSKIFNINLARLDTAIMQTKAYNQSGYAENIDVARLEVQYNNILTEKQNFENTYQFSLVLLKFQMGMPIDQSISLNDSIASLSLDPLTVVPTNFDYTQRIEYSLLRTQERLQTLDVKRIKFSRLPTLTAFGTGGVFTQESKFTNLFHTTWYPYSLLGLNLSVPIFNMRSTYQAQQSRLTLLKTQNTIKNTKNAFETDAYKSRLSYVTNLAAMQNQKRNMELAQEVARVSKIKYQEGVGSNLEVVNAESDLKQSQINYYQALYDAMVAKIDYQIATGTLYNGQ